MAESTGNANTNYQENVVIVEVDVHHFSDDDDSQISQIFDPDKASEIAQGQEKDLEHRKTPAEYMREYRARKKHSIQSTSGSLSLLHRENGILRAADNLNNSHELVELPCQDIKATRRKTPAEYMREYRARKKNRIQTTSDTPLVVHRQDDILQADDNLNKTHDLFGLPFQDINATRRKTPAEYMREYRARKKNRIQSTSESLLLVHHQEDYILQADENVNNSHELVGSPCQDINAKRRKTPAERMREYRARKKNRIQSTSDSPSVVHHREDDTLQADDNLNNSHELVGLPCQDINATRRKTPAERMREYRVRKKNRNQSTGTTSVIHHQEDDTLQTNDSLNISHEFVGFPCQDINVIRRKTPAERMRQYRARKKNRKQSTSGTTSLALQKVDDNINSQPADDLNNSHEFVELSDQDIIVTSRKTVADRMREYRRRRRRIVESALVQKPKSLVPYVKGSGDITLLNYSDFYCHSLTYEEFKLKCLCLFSL